MSIRGQIDDNLHGRMMDPRDRGTFGLLMFLLITFVVAGFILMVFFRSHASAGAVIIPHPQGCPATRFCGCAASVKVFGKPIRDLYLARNWFRFPPR